ncbi:MAG: hypothetical protein E6Y08_16350 [Paenibacillus sp.]|uniref:hypothetical protein n=1 Tax=Paenibacillus sp. TaxID=58172 RepID=UPI0029119083|nr:hypothetical protein [Paenibacillus sp.]MDU4697383.1 hypothetical protein [Paenibacillus sp.]
MNNKILIPLMFILILTSCSLPNRLEEQSQSETYALYHNIFYHQYSNQLHLFSDILSSLMKEPLNEAELAYIQGKIEGYSENTWFVFYALNRGDSPSLDLAVPAELRSSIYDLITLTNSVMDGVSREIDTHKKWTVAKDNQELMIDVIRLCQDLNVPSSYLKDEQNRADYEERLQQALMKIKELQGILEN